MEGEEGGETLIMEQGQSLALNGPSEFPSEFGDYRLLRFLGRGGMGTVYEAEHRVTKRRIALKMLGQQLESSDMRRRFLREGRLAAGVSHPNSLYVYGAEEIEGVPVITMEIADRGTLSDKLKKKGPLPIVEAVDAALGIIAGLESAHAVGVLHRDVKPSNIFVSPDGEVKVGDYGLSVSTVASIDSFATATGVALGTPAYAAPEQLKGNELDLRADIYSVGATLFTLLTDQAPIVGNNPVQIVAAALDEKPATVSDLRSDVPAGLSALVARCLAKKPEHRFEDYGELRSALLPFSSETAQPGAIPRRFLAGVVDGLFSWFFPGALVTAYYGRMNTVEMAGNAEFWPLLGLMFWQLIFTGIPEGLWGAGLGKWMVGLRVARCGGQGLGISRGLIRSLGNWVSCQGAIVVLLLINLFGIEPPSSFMMAGLMYLFGQVLLLLSPFLSMRRRNGWAVLWDLLSDSRVIEKPKQIARPRVFVEEGEPEVADAAEWMGPYAVLKKLTMDWIVGIDPTLRRSVWLRRNRSGSLDSRRRDIVRSSRSRWQQSMLFEGEAWDVFEAQSGVPLQDLLQRDGLASWGSMRFWLHDLTMELAQGAQDGTLPTQLSLAHIWITASGRAVLMDDAWPGSPSSVASFDVTEMVGKLAFLNCVANSTDSRSIPIHARCLLKSLAAGSFEKLSFLAGNLLSLTKKRVCIESATRAASLLALPVFLFVFAVFSMLVAGPASMRAKSAALRAEFPELPALNDVLRFRYSVPVEERRFVHVHIAGHYDHEGFASYADWEHFRLLTDHERTLLKQITDPGPTFASEELETADRRLNQELPDFLNQEYRSNVTRAFERAIDFVVRCLIWIAGLQIITLIAVGATAGQYLFGFSLVDLHGEPAGRPRLMLRWTIAWGLLVVAVLGESWLGDFAPFALIIWLIGVAVAVVQPTRGLHDEWSGCSLVSR